VEGDVFFLYQNKEVTTIVPLAYLRIWMDGLVNQNIIKLYTPSGPYYKFFFARMFNVFSLYHESYTSNII
jgi:hypothetical protein